MADEKTPKRKTEKPKKRARKIKMEKPAESLTKDSSKNSPESLTENLAENLTDKLTAAAKDLYYISETDASFESFVWTREAGAEAFSAVNAADVLRFAGNAPDAPVSEQTTEDFFRNSVTEQDWHGDEEKATLKRFVKLKELIEKELREVKVFKIGEIELDVYIVGINSDGNLAGLKTKAVET